MEINFYLFTFEIFLFQAPAYVCKRNWHGSCHEGRKETLCNVFISSLDSQNRYNLFFVFQAKSVREFDKRFTSVMFGYQTIDDYYTDASPNHRLKSVAIPVLCLNSVDDVFSPSHGKTNIFAYILTWINCFKILFFLRKYSKKKWNVSWITFSTVINRKNK